MPATALGNPITGVLMVFRALDTVLETVVVLLAAHRRLGAGSATPSRRVAGDAGDGQGAGVRGLPGTGARAVRPHGRCLPVVGRSRCPWRQVPGRCGAGFHGSAADDGGSDPGDGGDQRRSCGRCSLSVPFSFLRSELPAGHLPGRSWAILRASRSRSSSPWRSHRRSPSLWRL